jgi:phage FluMu protein Com
MNKVTSEECHTINVNKSNDDKNRGVVKRKQEEEA